MVLYPLIFTDDYHSMRPTHTINKRFGIPLEDLLLPINYTIVRGHPGYCRSRSSTAAKDDSAAGSTIATNKDKFTVNLDVQQFTPEEITVKVIGSNIITVEGKHEEKEDEHGFVSRHFMRRYVLPDGYDINNVTPSLSSDGVLSITAPHVDQPKEEHRTISIQQTGVPLKPLENKIPHNEVGQKKD